MAVINGGATIWARQTIESEIFYNKPPEWFKVWFYIIQKVNHSNNKQFKKGEGYFNWTNIEANLKGITSAQYYECIKWLKRAKQITTQKTTRGNIIFVLNYAKYQDLKNYKTEAETEAETEALPKHFRSTSDTINKNDKNDKNDILSAEPTKPLIKKKPTSEAAELIQYWLDKWAEHFPAYEKRKITAWDKYVKRTKPFIKTYGLEKCKKICDLYLNCDDYVAKRENWSLDVFLTDKIFNKLTF